MTQRQRKGRGKSFERKESAVFVPSEENTVSANPKVAEGVQWTRKKGGGGTLNSGGSTEGMLTFPVLKKVRIEEARK